MAPNAENKPIVDLENWSVVDDVISPAYRELAPRFRLTGYTHKYRELPAGLIYTSAILRFDPVEWTVETAEAIYRLGAADPRYERWLRTVGVSDAA